MATNPHGARWDSALFNMVDLMSDPQNAVATLLDSLSQLSSDSARHTAYVKIGELDELLGDLSAAQESFQNASLVPGVKDFRSLLESARLLTQLGRLARASGQVRSIIGICPDKTLVAEAQVLSAKLDSLTGKTTQALATVRQLLASGEAATLSAQSLAELYHTCGRLGLKNDEAVVADLLAQNYPKSPEESLITGKVAPVPSPSLLLGYNSGPYKGEIATAGSAQQTPASHGPLASTTAHGPSASLSGGAASTGSSVAGPTIDIQIGSYLDPANARYRLQDLTTAGFAGQIVKASINGKTYYKVVVPRVPVDQSQNVLTRLKEKGFEGFLLYD